MSKRNGMSRFSAVPANLDIQRSRFDRSSNLKTSLNAGKLVPFYLDEVLPGDTFEMKTSYLARMSTPITPVMDTAFLDMYYFFIPTRLIWEHWKQFNGESDTAWDDNIDYFVPMFTPDRHADSYSLADYFGLPAGTPQNTYDVSIKGKPISILPYRAYQLVWNEWFRDQNTQDPQLINLGDTVSNAEKQAMLFASGNNGHLLPLNKKHDYFTSCLPAPQKGPSVPLPFGKLAPVDTGDIHSVNSTDLLWSPLVSDSRDSGFFGIQNPRFFTEDASDVSNRYSTLRTAPAGYDDSIDEELGSQYLVHKPLNLYADLTGLTGATVNALRQAFAIQRLYERDARSGSRYREFIKAHFNVTVPDSTVQVPEYLGGECVPLTVNQVVQMSSTPNEETPLGNTGAFSKTVGQNASFTKSFTEHGYILGVMGVRTLHTYQQGINKLWSRKSRFDFYLPVLANLGEMPVYTKEIFSSQEFDNDNVFGFQEAWAEYRYKPSVCTGAMRSSAPDSLDIWHYADDFSTRPYLDSSFIMETPVNIDRTLAVSSQLAHQVLVDMYFDLKCVRPMPLYSIPGLIDHH